MMHPTVTTSLRLAVVATLLTPIPRLCPGAPTASAQDWIDTVDAELIDFTANRALEDHQR